MMEELEILSGPDSGVGKRVGRDQKLDGRARTIREDVSKGKKKKIARGTYASGVSFVSGTAWVFEARRVRYNRAYYTPDFFFFFFFYDLRSSSLALFFRVKKEGRKKGGGGRVGRFTFCLSSICHSWGCASSDDSIFLLIDRFFLFFLISKFSMAFFCVP